MDWYHEMLQAYNNTELFSMKDWLINKGVVALNGRYTYLFSNIFMYKLTKDLKDIPWMYIDFYEEVVKYIQRKVEEAIAYHEEGVSKDVAVYLLMRDL